MGANLSLEVHMHMATQVLHIPVPHPTWPMTHSTIRAHASSPPLQLFNQLDLLVSLHPTSKRYLSQQRPNTKGFFLPYLLCSIL